MGDFSEDCYATGGDLSGDDAAALLQSLPKMAAYAVRQGSVSDDERRALLDALDAVPRDDVRPGFHAAVERADANEARAERAERERDLWREKARLRADELAPLRADNDRLLAIACALSADAEPDHTDPACVIPHPHPGRSCDSRSMLDADAEPEQPTREGIPLNDRQMAELNRQRERGWPDFHPEDYCHRCGAPNPSWSVDSDRFNAAMGEPESHQWEGIVCVGCFVLLHEAATGLTCTWRLVPETPFRHAGAGAEPPQCATCGEPKDYPGCECMVRDPDAEPEREGCETCEGMPPPGANDPEISCIVCGRTVLRPPSLVPSRAEGDERASVDGGGDDGRSRAIEAATRCGTDGLCWSDAENAIDAALASGGVVTRDAFESVDSDLHRAASGWEDAQTRVRELEGLIRELVRDGLHREYRQDREPMGYCENCGEPWPCPTYRARRDVRDRTDRA